MKKINLLFLFSFIVIGFTSCEKDTVTTDNGEYFEGVFVVNEGQFMHGNASLSFTDKNVSTIENEIFKKANGIVLGDQAQSIGFNNDKAYIVVTGSNKIEVADVGTMQRNVTITSGLNYPRYFETISENTALVTCWGDPNDATDDYLAVINTTSDEVTGNIPVALGPEKMVKNNDYLFIAHQGAYSTNNKVSVFDLILKQITHSITVGDRPNSMVIKDNYLWVLCGGEPSWSATGETAGQLFKIDINNNFTIAATYDFDTTEHPKFLSIDGDKLFYNLNDKVYQMDTNAATLPATEWLTLNGSAYNMEANDGILYITDAIDYQQEGKISAYDTSNAQLLNTKTAGLIPGDIGFHLE